MATADEVEKLYRDYWAPIVEKGGALDIEQVKRELFDFYQMIERVPKVYTHVTGGLISKHLTDPDAVCGVADDHYEELTQEAIAEDREALVEWLRERVAQLKELPRDADVVRELADAVARGDPWE